MAFNVPIKLPVNTRVVSASTRGGQPNIVEAIDASKLPANAKPVLREIDTGRPGSGGRFAESGEYQVEVKPSGGLDAYGFEIPAIVALYDASGNFKEFTTEIASEPGNDGITVIGKPKPIYVGQDAYLPNPKIDASGNVLNANPDNVIQKDYSQGGFFKDVASLAKEYSPMIGLALGANLFSGANLLGGGGAGAISTPVATQTALTGTDLGLLSSTGTTGVAGATGGLMGSALPAGTGAGGLFAPSVTEAGTSALSTAGTTTGATTSVASQVANEVASKGLIGDVLKKASEITGIDEATLGKLGSAGVQALLSSAGASKQAEQAQQAARTQADATIEAARIAADAAKFRPVGVTTRFGSSNFTTDAAGNVVSAGYTPSAEITGYQDRLSALANQGLTDVEGARTAFQPLTGAAQSLFNLGQGYLAKSPEEAAADYIAKQQALISPSRQTQLAELQNKLFQEGRGGVAVSQGGNLMATSPDYAAYYNAIARQDLALAAQADEEARRRIQFGSGLFDTGANLQNRFYSGQTAAYAPFATAMDTTSKLESLAERPLTLGTSIGERTTAGTAAGGRFLSEGITNAATTMAPSNAYSLSGDVLSGISQSPQVTSAIDRAFGVQPQQTAFNDQQIEFLKRVFA